MDLDKRLKALKCFLLCEVSARSKLTKCSGVPATQLRQLIILVRL